jgi:AcrR family transcriptional regulator
MSEIATHNRRDQRRDGILSVAREVFFEEGYSAASMSTIAARVGGSKGTLYNYFKNKEDLFKAHIEQQCAQFADEIFGTILADDQPVAEVLTQLGERYLEHIYADWAVQNFRLVIAEARRAPELARIFHAAGPAVGEDLLATYLEGAKRRGEIDSVDCKLAAHQFIALCRADHHFRFLLNMDERPRLQQIKADAAAAVSMFMAAYGLPRDAFRPAPPAPHP